MKILSKKRIGHWLLLGVLGSFSLGVIACANYQGIRTISEVKSFFNKDPHVAIPVFIDAAKNGNRDVEYASLSRLGSHYQILIKKIYWVSEKDKTTARYTNNRPTWESDLIHVEQFLLETYNDKKNDFNHRKIILRGLSHGLQTREASVAFFETVLSTPTQSSSKEDRVATEILVYTLKLLVQGLSEEAQFPARYGASPLEPVYSERFREDFLPVCETNLLNPSDQVFATALSCMITFANWGGETMLIAERLQNARPQLLAWKPSAHLTKSTTEATETAKITKTTEARKGSPRSEQSSAASPQETIKPAVQAQTSATRVFFLDAALANLTKKLQGS